MVFKQTIRLLAAHLAISRAHEIESSAAANVTLEDDKFLSCQRGHPIVGGSGNVISLETRGMDYYGKLYIGSLYREERMLYDTASSRVAVTHVDTKNRNIISNYDI